MKLSIIVPTRRSDLGMMAVSVQSHTEENTYELFGITDDIGLAAKLNYGIKLATGDYLIFLHDDCEVQPGWTDVLPGENEVGSFCLGENNDEFDVWGGFVNPPSYCTNPKDSPTYSYWLCIHRDAMNTIGLFDEHFTEPFYQDVDMGLTIKAAGYDIQCLPGKIIHHNGEGSGEPNERQRAYLNRKWGIEL
jgi:GT2 family glycosyltransferase